MESAFAPSVGIAITGIAVGSLIAAIVPTCLYLYVEPRGRLGWGVSGDAPNARRAPVMVRLTAWLSFAMGQFAIPWLLVPVACIALLYVQVRLGIGRPVGWAVTVAAGAMGFVQSLVALRMVPVGVRLLMRDARLGARVRALGRTNALLSASLVALAALMSWAMSVMPGLVHPWLSSALCWTALRPLMVYGAAYFLHAMMLGRCAKVLIDARPTGR